MANKEVEQVSLRKKKQRTNDPEKTGLLFKRTIVTLSVSALLTIQDSEIVSRRAGSCYVKTLIYEDDNERIMRAEASLTEAASPSQLGSCLETNPFGALASNVV